MCENLLILTNNYYVCNSGLLIPNYMTVLYVLITASSLVAGIFLIAFIWSVKTGQFDDSYTPSVRALFDDDIIDTTGKSVPEDSKTKNKNQNKSKNEND